MVPVRSLVPYAVVATAGSAFVAWGLREFLRATGGGYYCCGHFSYRLQGVSAAFVGWLLLLVAVRGSVRRVSAGATD